jgi:hypothetical protein
MKIYPIIGMSPGNSYFQGGGSIFPFGKGSE